MWLAVSLGAAAMLAASPAAAATLQTPPRVPAMPPAFSGAGAATEEDEGAVAAFAIPASHGYRLVVVANAAPHRHGDGEVIVAAMRKGAEAAYFAPALVVSDPSRTPGAEFGVATSVRANLGELGTISLDFKPSGGKKRFPSRCGDAAPSYATGSYEGSFKFRGEEGFTKATTARTRFRPDLIADLFCPDRTTSELRGSGLPGVGLRVRSNTERLEFRAVQNRRGGPANLQASVEEERESIVIDRTVEQREPSSVFSYDPMLRSAAISPHSPFSGHAVFHRRTMRPWTGNLEVDFPGRSNVPLVGPDFHASLAHAKLTTTHLHH
jgi:hypothetical protein